MRRINSNSDINFNASEYRGIGERYTIKFYTTNIDFSITKTNSDAVNGIIKLSWDELKLIGEGVLNFQVNNMSDDSDYDDGVYNSTFTRSTNYYIDSNVTIEDEDSKSIVDVIKEEIGKLETVIEEGERVTAESLNDLNSRINQNVANMEELQTIIEEDERVTAESLNDLNNRIEDIENN